MTTLTGIPRTLLFTLRARAEEHTLAGRLFADPVAVTWYADIELDADTKAAMQAAYSPVFQLGTAVRTTLYDNITTNFLKNHPDGLVIELGAGLTTRMYRLEHLGGRWVALDLAPAFEFRQQFEKEMIDEISLSCISASMLDSNWPTQLATTPSENILIIAEAVLFFLAPHEIKRLFTLLNAHFPGAVFAFDVLTQQFSPQARARFLAADAPMQWLLQDEQALASFDLIIQEQWVVTHVFLERWQALGFKPQQLLAAKGNIIFNTRLNALLN